LGQDAVLENLLLTGLRGVGKTVLLETFKPLAAQEGWRWVGADLSESASVTEDTISLRLLTDLAVVTSNAVLSRRLLPGLGFGAPTREVDARLTFETLSGLYRQLPGLVADKLKALLELVWRCLDGPRGLVFAYDEAQTMSDHAGRAQYPLSVLLDVFQSLQRRGLPFLLALTGLPTLLRKLVEARTYSERMFRVVFLDRLSEADSHAAILEPLRHPRCPVRLDEEAVATIVEASAGYPYFIQFVCREAFDAFVQGDRAVPMAAITRKLDSDFFAGRWTRATDRQRDLLTVIARLESCDGEFTVQQVVRRSRELLDRPFSSSHANQMLAALGRSGLVYKNRHGRYSLAVPLLSQFIRRQLAEEEPATP